MKDLNKIIKDCAAGDLKAQETIYKLFSPKMFGVCLRYAKDKMEAEDNLHEGFVKVFTKIDKFRGDGSFEGWVRRIMVNVSLEKYRKQNMVYAVEDMTNYDFEVEELEESACTIKEEVLLGLIQELPPRYRMVFNLYVLEGYNHKEISKEMNISVGTSKSNLARARNILKNKVTELCSEYKTTKNFSA